MRAALALVVACAVMASATLSEPMVADKLAGCSFSFTSRFTQTSLSLEQRCELFDSLNTCLSTVVVAANSDTAIDTAKEIILDAIELNTDVGCDLTQISFLGSVQTAKHRQARSVDSVFSLNDRIDTLASQTQDATTTVRSAVNDATAYVTSTTTRFQSIIDGVYSTGVNTIQSRVTSLNAALNSVTNTVNNQLSQSVVTTTATLSTNIAAEATSRADVSTQLQSLLNTLANAVTTGLNTATADRSNIRAYAVSSGGDISTTMASYIATATTTENGRAATEATAQTNAINSIRNSLSIAVAASVAAESTRADSACGTIIANRATIAPTVVSTYPDEVTCTVAGSLVYSSKTKRVLVCNGSNLIPLLTGAFQGQAFQGSNILNTGNYAKNLITYHGPNTVWTRCYSGTVHGFSSSTFHTNCNNKGVTLNIMKNSDGRVFGGYNDQIWSSRNQNLPSYLAYLFRFTSSTAAIETANPFNYPYAAVYDHSSYCPCFGSTNDFYLDSSCRTGSFSQWSYQSNIYNSNFLTGGTGLNLADIEVWYRIA